MTRALAIGLGLLAAAVVHAESVPVTACGDVIGSRQTGVLMNDLDCGVTWGLCRSCATCFPPIDPPVPCASSADCPDPVANDCYENVDVPPSVGVTVVGGGRLDMNGHAIRGARLGVLGQALDPSSNKGIRISGPGTISGTFVGVYSVPPVRLTGVALHDTWSGFYGYDVRLKDVDASGNTTGATVHDVKAIRLVADGNRYAGLFSYEGAHVSRSHLTGNAGADIATYLAPRVVATTCDHSAGLVPVGSQGVFDLTGPPWGVCTGD
jgi:hypothetical protein